MQAVLAALLVLACYASKRAYALHVVPPPPCACSKLETLSRTVSDACAAPHVAALPEMAAVCALAATLSNLSEYQRGILRETRLPAASNQAKESPSPAAKVQQHAAPAILTDPGDYAIPARLEGSKYTRHNSRRRHQIVSAPQEHRRRRADASSADMACRSSTKNSVLVSLKAHCAVPGCTWLESASKTSNPFANPSASWFEKDLTLACIDATAVAVPFNHTTCSFLAQPCTVGIHLNVTTLSVLTKSLQNAAMLLGAWQTNASVTLRGQWGTQGLSAMLKHAHKLMDLDAANAGVTSLSSDLLAVLTSLRTLSLKNNTIRNIDTGAFSTMRALEKLSLAGNEVTALPPQLFRNCLELSSLELDSNSLSSLDATIFQGLSALQVLSFGWNQLTRLPESLFQGLSNLQWLSVNSNKLATVDATIFHGLSALEVLDLGENQLTRLPEAGLLQGLTRLIQLHLHDNKLTHVDATNFHGLSALELLYLGHNQLTHLPKVLFQGLSALTVLLLESNNLAHVDATIFQGLSALEVLHLSQNQLAHLPKGLFQGLPRLSRLDLDNNRFADFDATSLETLSVLQVLDLGYNALTRLPEGLLALPKQLSSLSQLRLESTGISKLQLLADTELNYLTLKDSRQLKAVLLQLGARVVVADVTGTAMRIEALPCESLGYRGLVARSMQHLTSLDLLHKCMGSERQFLDASDNSEHRLEAVRDTLANVAASFLMGNASWVLPPNWEPVRDHVVVFTMVNTPVQCSTGMAQQNKFAAFHYGSLTLWLNYSEPLQMFTCICIPGYYEDNGMCREVIPFIATPGGIAAIVLSVIALVVILAYGPIKRRLRHARHDLDMQRGLLEYAETEVLALKRVWEIEAEEVTLLKRIDGDSEGAFGIVWRGDWDGMVVAVKVLRAGLLELDSGLADEFEREADFLMRARHTNVVRFFGAGRMPGGEPFVVLELVARGSLRGLLRGDRALLLDRTGTLKRRLALDVTRGMAYIHSLGALHRDLKSGNVLVTENWRGKVADFGSMRTLLAAAAAGNGQGAGDAVTGVSGSRSVAPSRLSHAREMTLTAGVGTPLYMAPEVLRGDDYGEAADVWAFGVMVWELVEQRVPDMLVEMGEQGRGPMLGRLLKLLEAGNRLQLDAGAPAWAQRVVSECTVAEASKRPSFVVLLERLSLAESDGAGGWTGGSE